MPNMNRRRFIQAAAITLFSCLNLRLPKIEPDYDAMMRELMDEGLRLLADITITPRLVGREFGDLVPGAEIIEVPIPEELRQVLRASDSQSG
jgi:hypothetical protein